MPLNPKRPITYLITDGLTTAATTSVAEEFLHIVHLIDAAVEAGVSLIQIREKSLSARVLFELTCRAAGITRGSSTQLLINDRADIACAAGADGVHLTTHSVSPEIVRRVFGDDFVIGVSTHSLNEAARARETGATFIVFGPVFEPLSKTNYVTPVGLKALTTIADALAPLPVLALGGITTENARECLNAGASGVAGISLFASPEILPVFVTDLGNWTAARPRAVEQS